MGFASVQGAAKVRQHLRCKGFRPDSAYDIAKMPADQRLNAGEGLVCSRTGLAQAELRIDHINTEGRVLDQVVEGSMLVL